jgi:hypothetical protein
MYAAPCALHGRSPADYRAQAGSSSGLGMPCRTTGDVEAAWRSVVPGPLFGDDKDGRNRRLGNTLCRYRTMAYRLRLTTMAAYAAGNGSALLEPTK